MRLRPSDFDALAAFFDPTAVAAVMRDVFDKPPSDACGSESGGISVVSRVAAADDRVVLGRLLPREVYDYWRQAGNAGLYAMTFMLRHAVAFLALSAHDRACSSCGAQQGYEKYYVSPGRPAAAELLDILTEPPFPQQSFPLLGFSAFGVYFFSRQAGFCRAFDAYAIGYCGEPAEGLFCSKHRYEAWWEHDGAGASTQADMFRFYAQGRNLYAYEEHQLEDILSRFWSRMAQYRRSLQVPDRDISEALAFFGYPTFADVCASGQVKLRRRYSELARQLHPDMGGGHESFLVLKKHYEVLRNRLSFENARA